METESWNKIRYTLRKQSRKTQEFFDIMQKIYYKCISDKKWNEPHKVIGQDGSLVFIRHGGCYVKVHCSRVQVLNINTEN